MDATEIYYGNVAETVEQLASLRRPVMGHFGTQDTNINKEMVNGIEQAMAKADKANELTDYWYDADHASLERFLFRLTQSKYADQFLLKGALLFKALI